MVGCYFDGCVRCGAMNHRLNRRVWISLHLGLGLLWIFVLSLAVSGKSEINLDPSQVAQMLALAGWLPTIALACWQVSHRRWRALFLSDLLGSGLLVLLACTAYLPLFFFQVVWFLPFALLPRGCITEVLVRAFRR
ncbi:MAG: hypothetical protein RLZZ54_2168 [Cyanobacteriota bacterium]|jgi:hypothetical protein